MVIKILKENDPAMILFKIYNIKKKTFFSINQLVRDLDIKIDLVPINSSDRQFRKILKILRDEEILIERKNEYVINKRKLDAYICKTNLWDSVGDFVIKHKPLELVNY